MPIVAIVILLIIAGLFIKWWFVALPLMGVAIVAFAAWFYFDRRNLAQLGADERAATLQHRKEKRAAWLAEQHHRVEQQKAQRAEKDAAQTASRIQQGKRVSARLTDVAASQGATGGALACPNCGGTSFVPRRRTATKVAFGVASLAGRPRHVECVTCGAMFKRH